MERGDTPSVQQGPALNPKYTGSWPAMEKTLKQTQQKYTELNHARKVIIANTNQQLKNYRKTIKTLKMKLYTPYVDSENTQE